jgi:hypothetical protein
MIAVAYAGGFFSDVKCERLDRRWMCRWSQISFVIANGFAVALGIDA